MSQGGDLGNAWALLDLAEPRRMARLRRVRRFWLLLAIPQCLAVSGMMMVRAISPAPRVEIVQPPGPPPDNMEGAARLRHWQKRREETIALFAMLSHQLPEGLALTSLKQREAQLTLTGMANRLEALPLLEQTLTRQSGYPYRLRREASGGFAMARPVQHFLLELSKHAPKQEEGPP
ncbi:MAG: PilN domain-containing protein [Paludibacterium sp.]|uniref:PilN domain-containing protein n=1 Tax=Paludibacterium sp. TaxID=1917523 RepID=UPI0025FB7BEA|nr:PilN domain-containing protein [Paludibacterium sp.]MBV8046675.1 PilN domain-containing protein [Paludibacterium sp.]MBV8649586.1 PilN domain-containing protein [Paludibacterium sp.]